MHYITEIGLTSRFFQVYHSYHTVYHENSGTLPLNIEEVYPAGYPAVYPEYFYNQ